MLGEKGQKGAKQKEKSGVKGDDARKVRMVRNKTRSMYSKVKRCGFDFKDAYEQKPRTHQTSPESWSWEKHILSKSGSTGLNHDHKVSDACSDVPALLRQ